MADSKGRVHDKFTRILEEIVKINQETYDAVKSDGGGRRWFLPPQGDWSGDVQDIAGMTNLFDRQDIETNYEEIYQDAKAPGTVGDVISLKMQSDYIACIERSFRARHATSVRCIALHMGRRKGHGDAESLFTTGVLKFAQDALIAGQEKI